jgi:TonB family protein
MIHVFQELAEKYGDSPIGTEAQRLATGLVISKPAAKPDEPSKPAQDTTTQVDTTLFALAPDTLSDPQLAEARLRAVIDNTPLITIEKTLSKGEFNYPISASASKIEGKVQLRIKIEFDGRVTEVEFIKSTGNVDIDTEIRKAMLETYFEPNDFDPTKFPGFFLYNYEFKLPEMYK